MKRIVCAAVLLAGAAVAQPVQPLPDKTWPVADAIAAAPHATIRDGRITARIALPDPARGFYRGTRFDQAGVITSLTVDDHEFYGPWFERIAPDVLDYVYTPDGIAAGPDSAISGPVEEFGVIGFAPKPGAQFVKIGVGLLLQPDEKEYDKYRHYRIVDGGSRRTVASPDRVTFAQTLAGHYDYEKTLRLTGGRLVIEHRLKNLGTAAISTTVYDHNFLKMVPGAGVSVEFPFAVKPAAAPPDGLVRIDGMRMIYLRPFGEQERLSLALTGYGATPADYDFTVRDAAASVHVTGDRPLARINTFTINRTVAIEPTIAVDIAPGATMRWTYTYDYKAGG